MKKRTRKLMCLALVCLLTACMVVPAAAETVSDSGNSSSGQYTYSWSISRTNTNSRVTFTTTTVPATVGVVVQNVVYCVEHRIDGDAWSTGSTSLLDMNPITGYASISATAANVFEGSDDVIHSGNIQRTYGYFYINGGKIITRWV